MKRTALFPISDHCDGRIFFNPDRHTTRTWCEVLRWKLHANVGPWPTIVPVRRRTLDTFLPARTSRVTWINHASFLLQTPAGNLLVDPIYSDRCGPFGLLGPRRVHPPGIALRDLPKIDVVLLSHDHYDHCDVATLRQLARRDAPIAITPLGNRDLLRRGGFTRIVELDWWQNHIPLPGLLVTVTPARHWSNRLSGRRCGRLWGGFFLNVANQRLYLAGDTGYDTALFSAIRARLGAPDLALIPIGAYKPRWFMRGQHCNPAEAVQIHLDLQARTSIAAHWGTFSLADDGRDEPPRALSDACVTAGISSTAFRILEPGENVTVSS